MQYLHTRALTEICKLGSRIGKPTASGAGDVALAAQNTLHDCHMDCSLVLQSSRNMNSNRRVFPAAALRS